MLEYAEAFWKVSYAFSTGKGIIFSPNIQAYLLPSVIIIAVSLLSSSKTRHESRSLQPRVVKIPLTVMPTLPESGAASQDRWEIHKETLRKHYLVEKKTLKEVEELMAKSYNFKAT
jgi:hypothetical protein